MRQHLVIKIFCLTYLLAFAVFAAQEPPEYPEGVVCTPAGIVQGDAIIDPDHPCHCKKMTYSNTSCEVPATNDRMCSQYCHEKHCRCPLVCVEGAPPEE